MYEPRVKDRVVVIDDWTVRGIADQEKSFIGAHGEVSDVDLLTNSVYVHFDDDRLNPNPVSGDFVFTAQCLQKEPVAEDDNRVSDLLAEIVDRVNEYDLTVEQITELRGLVNSELNLMCGFVNGLIGDELVRGDRVTLINDHCIRCIGIDTKGFLGASGTVTCVDPVYDSIDVHFDDDDLNSGVGDYCFFTKDLKKIGAS